MKIEISKVGEAAELLGITRDELMSALMGSPSKPRGRPKGSGKKASKKSKKKKARKKRESIKLDENYLGAIKKSLGRGKKLTGSELKTAVKKEVRGFNEKKYSKAKTHLTNEGELKGSGPAQGPGRKFSLAK